MLCEKQMWPKDAAMWTLAKLALDLVFKKN